MSFFKELKQRNVIRVGIAYLAVAWLLIEVSNTILPMFDFDPGLPGVFSEVRWRAPLPGGCYRP